MKLSTKLFAQPIKSALSLTFLFLIALSPQTSLLSQKSQREFLPNYVDSRTSRFNSKSISRAARWRLAVAGIHIRRRTGSTSSTHCRILGATSQITKEQEALWTFAQLTLRADSRDPFGDVTLKIHIHYRRKPRPPVLSEPFPLANLGLIGDAFLHVRLGQSRPDARDVDF